DDDVLHGAPLQQKRVDEDVEQQAGEREARGEQVGGAPEQPEGEQLKRDCERQRLRRANALRDGRARRRALHSAVYVAVNHHVERVGRACRGVAAEGDGEKQRQRYAVVSIGRDEQGGEGGE